MRQGGWWLALGIVSVGVLLIGVRAWNRLDVNIAQVVLVQSQAAGGDLKAGDEATWEAGWRSLCQKPHGNTETSVSVGTLLNVVQAQIDRGAYGAALAALDRAATEGWIYQVEQASAFRTALQMKWSEAAKLYQPERTPRMQRWWGTIFYLAAQQEHFANQTAEAAPFYRQADALYDTQGPYLGLALAKCLQDQNRPLEAWDALRRGLVVLPVDEALTHTAEFEALRLAALKRWQQLEPQNEQVQRWLEFYRTADSADETEVLTAEPTPEVKVEANLSEEQKLIGFDYRAEDIETGPFMTVDLYTRYGDRLTRERRTVLNQAPNGSFMWDAVPDGVRSMGWHGYVYDHTPESLSRREIADTGLWLCLINHRSQSYFGTQSSSTQVTDNARMYLQGGTSFTEKGVALGRNWQGQNSAYSYTLGGHTIKVIETLRGTWQPPDGTRAVNVWVLSENGCVKNLYMFEVPTL